MPSTRTADNLFSGSMDAEAAERGADTMPSLTRSFERAIAKAATLPDNEQDMLAALIFAEIEDARLWDDHFADDRSPALLERLAAEARAEDEAGLTKPLEELLAETEEDTPAPPQTRG